ncbi:hypothetical protein J6590_032709 [Homalodisca vitripennis]|nr:hypothetical protein J6590_032709 [Homalodisca vitripennis]
MAVFDNEIERWDEFHIDHVCNQANLMLEFISRFSSGIHSLAALRLKRPIAGYPSPVWSQDDTIGSQMRLEALQPINLADWDPAWIWLPVGSVENIVRELYDVRTIRIICGCDIFRSVSIVSVTMPRGDGSVFSS